MMKRRSNFHSLVPSTVLFFLSVYVSQETLFVCQTMRNIAFLNLILHSGPLRQWLESMRLKDMNGPLDKATLSHPAGIAVRSAVIYIAEHPSVYQGATCLCYSLEGFVKFQSAWKDIASSMGLVSKREALQNQEKAKQTETKVLDDSLPEMQIAAASLRNIVESCNA